jgi:chromosome segregation ATPase|tara:strand:+ start:104 stop:1246 length:1143 start_codon:yes stop_codon:yes gene_type:complete
MGLTSSIIETGVDKLVNLVNKTGRISSNDAAKTLGMGVSTIMEWADFLEEEGIINIEYKFTKPFLVARKLAKKDVKEKAKEFSGKKDVFVRKAEVSLSFLGKESEKLKTLKEEFDKIKQDLGLDMDSIKNEMAELQKYEQLKISLDQQIGEQKTSAVDKLREMTNLIVIEGKKYHSILDNIKKEEAILEKEKSDASSIEESEKVISDKLNSLKVLIAQVEVKVKAEEENVLVSERNIQSLSNMADTIKAKVEKEKSLIEPLIEDSRIQAEKIKTLQDTIVKKIENREEKLKGVKTASQKMKLFFKKKVGVLDLIEKVNKDRNDLQNELIGLMKKAKSFQLSSKSASVGNQITGLEKKFKEVDNKKKIFEKELEKVNKFFK